MKKQEDYEDLFWKEIVKPTLIIMGIIYRIAVISSFILININFEISIMIIIFATIIDLFVALIGIGARGLDFEMEKLK